MHTAIVDLPQISATPADPPAMILCTRDCSFGAMVIDSGDKELSLTVRAHDLRAVSAAAKWRTDPGHRAPQIGAAIRLRTMMAAIEEVMQTDEAGT